MKNRPARVQELIKRELGAIIAREMTFEAKLVTIHEVDLTPDFKNCHIHVGVLGTDPERRAALSKLHTQRPHLQHELSRRVILKYTPHLHFHLDQAIERGTKVMEILRQMNDTGLAPVEEADEFYDRTVAAAEGYPVPAGDPASTEPARDEDDRDNDTNNDDDNEDEGDLPGDEMPGGLPGHHGGPKSTRRSGHARGQKRSERP